MRAGLAAIAVLALCATPVAAQGKTKPGAVPQSVAALEMCETFATGDVLAVEAAIEKGWDASEDDSESPFVHSYSGGKDLPGIGYASMFALVEDYPNRTFGYCRVDVNEVTGDAEVAVQSIQNLDRYEGQAIQNGAGTFASLTGKTDKNRMLLTHVADNTFLIQLSIITPKADTAE
ncbi:hypothetical protein ASD04_06665 [Devosia sp. Root436]|uniref:hypothetical protein n=1 Tax=Devosia sp. Root436 TaxID=1736537 RepID=UPI0007010CA9|nr:hypothetical protein [Devosia sp. Root436]KQX40308.1 hypothetical protein ASD04_06665 [Devosia sp. Root436]